VGLGCAAVEGLGMNAEFWRGRRVLVTGHTGFKGSWLVLWLERLGASVTGYALAPPTDPSLFEVARVGDGMTSILADVRDAARLRAAVHDAAPEVVLHLAAQSLVRASYEDPLGTFETNVLGTANLLDAVRDAQSVCAVVVVTTDKCYQNRNLDQPFREDEPMGGDDPYSASKGCAELVAASFRASYFQDGKSARVATARAGNVIGGGDWARDRLIPDMLAALDAGRPVSIRYPDATRPWQHVLEPLGGYLLLAEALAEGRPGADSAWNFGPAESDVQPVRRIADTLSTAWGEGAAWEIDGQSHPHEAATLRLDTAKARQGLHWQPRLALDTALQWIVDWHRARRGGNDMRARSLQDIERYEAIGAAVS
jgi:CDP-glucose 4,6-dehydratase